MLGSNYFLCYCINFQKEFIYSNGWGFSENQQTSLKNEKSDKLFKRFAVRFLLLFIQNGVNVLEVLCKFHFLKSQNRHIKDLVSPELLRKSSARNQIETVAQLLLFPWNRLAGHFTVICSITNRLSVFVFLNQILKYLKK